jgi:hypothetical protein
LTKKINENLTKELTEVKEKLERINKKKSKEVNTSE